MSVAASPVFVIRRAHSTVRLGDLQVEHQIEPFSENDQEAWRSTGLHPTFRMNGPLRSGWWRFQVRIRRLDNQSAERVQADFRADFGNGIEPGPPLERIVWNAELDEKHIFFFLPCEARSLNFQPLSGPATFQIEAFSARRLSRLGSLFTALRHKLKLLRDYNCTGRVIGRGLRMLFSGRVREVWRKLFKALPDTRRYNPESDAYIRMVAGLGRSRVPLTRQERLCLQEECAELSTRPTIAVLLPVHGIAPHALLLGIESVLRQAYEEWELHVVLGPDAPPDQINVAEKYAERHERIHLTFAEANETIEEALAGALDRVEAEYLTFLQPGFELDEAALVRVMKARLEQPEAAMVLNQVPPPVEAGGRGVLSGSAFRPGAAGQQVNLYRLADVRNLERLPPVLGRGLPLGTEVARSLPADLRAAYFHETIAHPISCLTTLPAGPDEFVEMGHPPRPLLLTGNICGISGWDNVVFEIARGLHSLGVNLRLNAASHHQADLLPPYLLPARRLRRPEDLELLIAPPHLLEHHPHPPGCIVFTMWESDRLEPRWVEDLNQAARVIVPSHWAQVSFRASGVTAPIDVVPLGHDALTFHRDASWPDVCTFGTAAALAGGGVRKNARRLIEAFAVAFPHQDDVRLRVKLTPRCEIAEPDDARIEILRKFLLPSELADWYRSLTAYVNASAAEGFGLHLVEAMACGRPVISPAYSAVTEYFDDSIGFPVEHRLIDAEGTIYQGQWADLDDDDLVRVLRQVYDDHAEARRRGERAATRSKRFTWKETGRRLLSALEAHSRERLTARV